MGPAKHSSLLNINLSTYAPELDLSHKEVHTQKFLNPDQTLCTKGLTESSQQSLEVQTVTISGLQMRKLWRREVTSSIHGHQPPLAVQWGYELRCSDPTAIGLASTCGRATIYGMLLPRQKRSLLMKATQVHYGKFGKILKMSKKEIKITHNPTTSTFWGTV